MRVELDPAAPRTPPVASTTQSAPSRSSRRPTRTRNVCTRSPSASAPTTMLFSRTAPRARERRGESAEEPHPRHRRRQRRDLEHRPAERAFERRDRPRAARRSRARRGTPRARPSRSCARELGQHALAERRRVERSRVPELVDVGAALGRQVEHDRARVDLRPPQAVGEQRRMEVLERRRSPRPRPRRPSRRSPCAIVSGTTADGRSTPTAVGSSRLASSDPRGTGTRSSSQSSAAVMPSTPTRRVRMARALGQVRRQRLLRRVHPLGRVAEHVDRARRVMRRADALGQHEHARAALGQPHGGGQPRQAGADHDHVVVTHAGRCSTSSRPWKIQSSSRAWRSWSP